MPFQGPKSVHTSLLLAVPAFRHHIGLLIHRRLLHTGLLALSSRDRLLEFGLDFLLREAPRLGAQHVRELLLRHADLVAHGHEAVGKVHIVLLHQLKCHHQVVDVVEDKRSAVAVGGLGFDEVHGLIAPVSARVQVVAGVVAVIEAEAVAL